LAGLGSGRLRGAVSELGAILLTEDIVADGFHAGARVRVVTHVHSDHLEGFSRSVRLASFIAATPLTMDLLEAMGYRVPPSKRLPVSYGVKVSFDGAIVKLVRARHIPGSASVLVEAEEGSVGYTGDFKLPGTDILRGVDVLVIDATYGLPEHVRPWQEEVEYILADLVLEQLRLGKPVTVYAYNGKIEEVMVVLREHGVSAPYLVTGRHARVLRVLERHGYDFGDIVVEGSPEGIEVERSGWYVRFRHYRSWWAGNGGRAGVHVLLTGWEFSGPYRWVSDRRVIVSFSDHADFRQLVEYVREARPRRVVVDAYRGGTAARVFAAYLRRKLDIPAEAQP
jgi:putative mRNA 3-end processing factor